MTRHESYASRARTVRNHQNPLLLLALQRKPPGRVQLIVAVLCYTRMVLVASVIFANWFGLLVCRCTQSYLKQQLFTRGWRLAFYTRLAVKASHLFLFAWPECLPLYLIPLLRMLYIVPRYPLV